MEMKGEELSFLANFVSEDIMTEFFGYQQQQASKTLSDSRSHGGGMADMVNEIHSSNIGEQSNTKYNLHVQQKQQSK